VQGAHFYPLRRCMVRSMRLRRACPIRRPDTRANGALRTEAQNDLPHSSGITIPAQQIMTSTTRPHKGRTGFLADIAALYIDTAHKKTRLVRVIGSCPFGLRSNHRQNHPLFFRRFVGKRRDDAEFVLCHDEAAEPEAVNERQLAQRCDNQAPAMPFRLNRARLRYFTKG